MQIGTRVGAVLVFGAVVAGSAAQVASAAILTLNPSKDNTLFEDTTGSLSDAKGDGLFVGETGASLKRRALLAFDLSSIPAGSVITSATLTMNVSRPGFGLNPNVEAHRVTQNWGEGTSLASGTGGGTGGPATNGDATWIHTFYSSSLWTNPGGDFVATASGVGSAAGPTFLLNSAGITADVQGWYANPATNFGWILIGDETTASTAKRLDSRENATVSARPVLTVNFSPVPEPGMMGMLAGAGVLGLRRRGRERRLSGSR